ncbi:DUF1768 domain-containing protein [candidate division GN15 bacterium]|nr:DUF1768 domain-containing protein [candidate division GN15 bacterium]
MVIGTVLSWSCTSVRAGGKERNVVKRNARKSKKVIFISWQRLNALTNDAPYAVRISGITWPTVTHYLTAKRHVLDAAVVRDLPSVDELQTYVREAKLPSMYKWEVYRDELLMLALRSKIDQHPALEAMLMRTRRAKLIHLNSADTYLGVGPLARGQNMLGRGLMQIRRRNTEPSVASYLSMWQRK